VARFAPAEGLGADGETGPEAANLAAWGGELGRGAARGVEILGVGGGGAAEIQKADLSEATRGRQLSALNGRSKSSDEW